MSKRAPGLPQRPRGLWLTPKAAVAPLIPFLPLRARYGEPCAADGNLIRHLFDLWPAGRCIWSTDIVPEGAGIDELSATEITAELAADVDLWITNPPWPKIGQRGDPAVSIIKHLSGIAPVWALLPWDFAANDYFAGLSASCSEVVPIGRVSWMGNGQPGKDNAAWYRFDARNRFATVIHARGKAA